MPVLLSNQEDGLFARAMSQMDAVLAQAAI